MCARWERYHFLVTEIEMIIEAHTCLGENRYKHRDKYGYKYRCKNEMEAFQYYVRCEMGGIPFSCHWQGQ